MEGRRHTVVGKSGKLLMVFCDRKIVIYDSRFDYVQLTDKQGGELLAALFDYFSGELARSRKAKGGV